MKTKLFSTISIIVLFLTSCSDVFSPATSTPTVTSTSTLTITPSSTATPSPTITPSPTETPDPNRPADATGRDRDGYFKEVTEAGQTIVYRDVTLKNANGETLFRGWFTSHILNGSLNGGIPLYDLEAIGYPKSIPLYVYVQEGLEVPYLYHPQNPIDQYAPNFSRLFFTQFELAYFNEKDFRKISSEKSQIYYSDFNNGKIYFPFSTPTGNYVWKPSQTKGYKFYAIKWDEADPATHPEIYETGASKYRTRWAIMSDFDGNLIGIAAHNFGGAKDEWYYQKDDFFSSIIL